MKRIILSFLIVTSQMLFSQNSNNSVGNFEFLKLRSFPIPALADYYVNIMDMQMNSVNKNNKFKYGFIDKNGKVFKNAEFNYASDFVGKHSNIVKDGIHGILFKNGNIKYFPEYEMTYWTEEKLGMVIKDKKYGFINTKGKIIVPLIYDDAFPFYNGYASVKKGKKWHYIDRKGKEIKALKNSLTSYKPIINNLVSINDTTKPKTQQSILKLITTGLFEMLNNVSENEYPESLLEIKNNKIHHFSNFDDISGYFINGYMIAMKNGKIGVINSNSEIIIPFEYDEIKDIKNDIIIAKKNNLWGALDVKNRIVIPFEYNYFATYSEGLAMVSKDTGTKKIGYIDFNNKIIVEPNLDFCWYRNFHEGVAVVKKANLYGFIDNKGTQIIPYKFSDAYPFVNNIALIQSNETKKYFFINKKGEKITDDEYNILYPIKNGFARFIN